MRLALLSALVASAAATTSRSTPPSGSITVCKSGCNYSKIQSAVSSISTSSTAAHQIFVYAGTYTEQVTIPALAGKLTIYGQTTDTSSYTKNVASLEWDSSLLSGAADDEHTAALINLSKNVAGYYGVGLFGYQDTLLAQTGNQVYASCYIEGAVDFIFGQYARIWVTQSRLAVTASGGSITASGRAASSGDSLFVIDQSTINAADSSTAAAGTVYLGRPWGAYARVVYQLNSLSSIINSAGWSVWSKTDTRTSNVVFQEYQNSGTGASGTRFFETKTSAPVTIDTVLGSTYGNWVDTTRGRGKRTESSKELCTRRAFAKPVSKDEPSDTGNTTIHSHIHLERACNGRPTIPPLPHLPLLNKLYCRPADRHASFQRFPRLPMELQDMVWQHCLHEIRVIELFVLHVSDMSRDGPILHDTSESEHHHVVTVKGRSLHSKMLRVCRNARTIALRFYRVHVPCFFHGNTPVRSLGQGTLYFNPEHDIIHFFSTCNEQAITVLRDLRARDPQHVGFRTLILDPPYVQAALVGGRGLGALLLLLYSATIFWDISATLVGPTRRITEPGTYARMGLPAPPVTAYTNLIEPVLGPMVGRFRILSEDPRPIGPLLRHADMMHGVLWTVRAEWAVLPSSATDPALARRIFRAECGEQVMFALRASTRRARPLDTTALQEEPYVPADFEAPWTAPPPIGFWLFAIGAVNMFGPDSEMLKRWQPWPQLAVMRLP
ncbi:pectinesterase precursor [Grosmannia clavigera kw1407]|uniref:pectinesterase n=1 Tax=Grosmannia clavigera (strain kw1407 / UAMH 11150) TaxID=655863 RepID=F0XH56_GROCL|nr:pectinesterase precursor [Grosmannia clavigera kw1407]EFX03076.1 pectinesterase precursor [Grosmannia clavigera kw1407]